MTHDDDPLLRGIAAAARRHKLFEDAVHDADDRLHEPLGEDFIDSTADRLAELVAAESSGKVVSLQPRRSRRLVLLGSAVAAMAVAAAALFLVTALPKTTYEPLPSYRIELVSGGAAAMRGAQSLPERRPVVAGTVLEIVARPQDAVEGPLEARAFALGESGKATQLPAVPQVAPGGAVRLRGMVGKDLALPSGTNAVWIAVGRPGKLPSAEELPELLSGKRSAEGFVVLGQPVHVQ